ncbi:MAG TPA: hypothetical protein VHQ65_09680 [Thermoanaerobaculia bacterium]|nr:hypothetical protein [Thermoanaerobaculia bacterium]
MDTKRLVWTLLVALVASCALAEAPEAELASRQWLSYYEFRRASQTKTCTLTSLEAPLTILLIERGGEQHHLVKIGGEVAPSSDAWIRIDDRESRKFPEGVVSTKESFALVRDMLLGGYAYIEWSSWPSRGIQEDQVGLGYFAWGYARCRAHLGWSVPESLKSVLARRYDTGPDLADPDVPTREEVDRVYETLLVEFERLSKELHELRDP